MAILGRSVVSTAPRPLEGVVTCGGHRPRHGAGVGSLALLRSWVAPRSPPRHHPVGRPRRAVRQDSKGSRVKPAAARFKQDFTQKLAGG